MSGRAARTFRSLGNRNYRLYLAGSAVSVSGTWMQRVAQDWLVLQLSGSAVALGFSLAAQFVPVLLLAPWAGTVVDRVDRRRLLLVTQTASGVLAAALAVVTLTGAVTLPMVYVLAAALGAVSAFDTPGRHVFVSEIVGVEGYLNAQALYSSVHNAGRFAGPALAGVVIAAFGTGAAFAVNAASFGAVVAMLAAIDVTRLHRAEREPPGPRQVREGFRYAWGADVVRTTLLLAAVIAIFGQNFRVVLPLLAEDTFSGDAQTYANLTALLGVGAVAGALATAGARRPTLRRLGLAALAFGAVNVLAAVAPSLALALLAMLLLGMANIAVNTMCRTLLVTGADPRLRGRVMAMYEMVFHGAVPLGAVLAGVACELWGARGGLAMAAVAALAAGGAVLVRRGAAKPAATAVAPADVR